MKRILIYLIVPAFFIGAGIWLFNSFDTLACTVASISGVGGTGTDVVTDSLVQAISKTNNDKINDVFIRLIIEIIPFLFFNVRTHK